MKKIFSLVLSLIIMISFVPTKIYGQEFSKGTYLVINSKTNKMGYFKDGYMIKEFPVATGKAGAETPKGKFKIVTKIKNRPYYKGGIAGGDPKNPLGDRWLGLHVGSTYGTTYAIHGNNKSSSIGSNVSAGCVRMYNDDIRWLYEQVPKGSYAIIYNGEQSYSEIAKKYGVNLSSEIPLSNKQLDVIEKFNNFSVYGPISSPIVDLNNKNSIISTLDIANNILKMGTETNKSERALFVEAWNSLSKEEINHKDVSFIYSKYQRAIAVAEASQAVNAFYEKVNSYAKHLLTTPQKAISLNDISNQELGARGYAKKMYDNVVNTFAENETNSPRMKDLFDKYSDAVNFLNIAKNIQDKNISTGKEKASKLKSNNLKTVANSILDSYSDIDGHWAYNNIKNAMNKTWVGTTKNFRPNDSITRAEFIKIVNKALGYYEGENVSFKDVNKKDWYYSDVCIAVTNGYIGGYSNNTFKPNEPITREEVAAIIARIKGNSDSKIDKINKFDDVEKVSNWAKSAFEGCVENGYLNGYSDNTLKPKNKITRAEAIVTIERLAK